MKATAYVATSIDGFIARENGEVDFLDDPSFDSTQDYGFYEFMDTVDYLVMGSYSFEKVLSFGEWHYKDKPVVVLTSRDITTPDYIPDTVEFMSCPPTEVIDQLTQRGANHLYIDGGKTIRQFLNAGLIQRFIITRIPILIGSGIPLFGPLQSDIKLHHVDTKIFPDGLTQSEYEVS